MGVGQAILGVGDRSDALLFGVAIFGIAIGNLGFVLWRYTNCGRSSPEAPLGAGDGASNGGMRRALGAGVLLPLAVALLVVWAVVFGWVALGTWSIGPDEYADASEWWFDFAIPRAVGSLAVAIPAALVAALGARRLLGRSGQ